MTTYITLVIKEIQTRDGWEFSEATAFADYISARQWILDQKPSEILEDWGDDEDREMDGFVAIFDGSNGDTRMSVSVANYHH